MGKPDLHPISQCNQDITGEASTSLLCSSTASCLDPGSNTVATFKMGEEKECSHHNEKWHYMFLRNSEMKRYVDILTGQRAVIIASNDSEEKIERYFKFKIFVYTSADHRRRFTQCSYTDGEYKAHKQAAITVKDAFASGDTQALNTLIDKDKITGDGYLFVCGSKSDLNIVLANTLPHQYLVTNRSTGKPAIIPARQMEEFIYLYESMPYNIELLEHPIEEYIKTKQKIRITAGIFKGKEGCLMRLHRNMRLVFALGTMTIAIPNLHSLPFEPIKD